MHQIFFLNSALIIGDLIPAAEKSLYLDPGSGSFILQILLAALLGGFFIFRSYVARLFNSIKRLFGKGASSEEDDE